jgi:tetratricopeptide (TPR) repeat protein
MPQDDKPSKVNQSQVAAQNLNAGRDVNIGPIEQTNNQTNVYYALGLSLNARQRRFVQWFVIGVCLTCLIGGLIHLWTNGADSTTLLLLILFAIPLLTYAGFFVWQLIWQSVPPNDILLLVADFDGRDQKDYRLTEKFLRNLKEAVKPYYPDVKVQSLYKVITEQQGSDIARVEGRKKKATIVIWGWYGVLKNFSVIVNFELIRPPDYFPQITEDTQTLTDGQNLAISELDTWTLPTSLNGMSYLTLFTIGMARYAAKDWDGAIDRFSKALAQVETDAPALGQYAVHFYRGLSYTFKNNYKGAVLDYKTLDKNLGLTPDIIEAYNDQEGTHVAQINYTKALEDYNQALNLKSDFPEAYNNRAGTHIAQGNYTKAIEDCNQALKLNQNNADAYNNLGIAHSRQGNYTRAIEDYDQAIELKRTAKTYTVRGIAYAHQGNYIRAIGDYDQAIELNPDYAEAYSSRGIAYDELGNYAKAIDNYNQALHLKQDYDGLHRIRGFAYHELGDYPKAIADYSQALNLKPSAEIYNSRGNAHAAQGNYTKAIEDYDKAVELKQDYALAYFNRGVACNDQGNYLEAIKDYDKAIELNPDADSYNNRGNAYVYQKNYAKAITDFNKALSFKPDSANAYLGQGIAYYLSGDKNNATQSFEKVLELTQDIAMRQAAEQSLRELQAK